jgi:hypothetical protein
VCVLAVSLCLSFVYRLRVYCEAYARSDFSAKREAK